MQTKNYRRQVEKIVKNAAVRQKQQQLEANIQSKIMCQNLQTQSAILNAEDAKIIEGLVLDKKTDSDVRAAAIARLGFGDDARVDLDQLIAILSDKDEAPVVRLHAIHKLEDASFERLDFADLRPQYLAALRDCIDSDNDELLYTALDVLASNKDTFVQEKLLKWLRDSSRSPISVASVLQLLGNDIHAGVYTAAKQVLADSQDEEVRIEALRLLASDGETSPTFRNIMFDKNESTEIRRLAISVCKSLAPNQFQEDAFALVKDENEEESLRVTALTGLAHSTEFLDNDNLRNSVQKVCDSSKSSYIRTIAGKYLARISNNLFEKL